MAGAPAVTLVRWCYGPLGTFGTMQWGDDSTRCFTVEQPWRDNQVRISCIPEGTYLCRPRRFIGGGYDAIEVADVPGRTNILIHKGNVAGDVSGCVAVGQELGIQAGTWSVNYSAQAFDRLMKAYGGKQFWLEIRSARIPHEPPPWQ